MGETVKYIVSNFYIKPCSSSWDQCYVNLSVGFCYQLCSFQKEKIYNILLFSQINKPLREQETKMTSYRNISKQSIKNMNSQQCHVKTHLKKEIVNVIGQEINLSVKNDKPMHIDQLRFTSKLYMPCTILALLIQKKQKKDVNRVKVLKSLQ